MIESKVPAPESADQRGSDNKRTKHTRQAVKREISRLEELVFKKKTIQVEENIAAKNVPKEARIERSKKQKVAAWMDLEDLSTTVSEAVSEDPQYDRQPALQGSKEKYQKMLKEQFLGVIGTPKWATQREKEGDDDFSAKVFRSSDRLLETSGTFAANHLNFTKLPDMVEKGATSKSIITAIDFNPSAPVAITANKLGNVIFYQVEGESNSILHKATFKNYPISSAKFLMGGKELLLGSEYKASMQCYDLNTNKATVIPSPTKGPEISNMDVFTLSNNGDFIAVAGKDGTVGLLTTGTKELIHTVKMSGRCQALAFSSDSTKLITYGTESKVYVWDVRQRKCLHRFVDDTGLGGLSLSLSAGDQYLACGSASGVVNIYHGSSVLPSSGSELSMYPQPAKAIMNLTTAAHKVVFNPTGQLLAASSTHKDSALKLVHLPSMTVFANFPNKSLNLARVESIAFSPNGGYMAVGNNIGGGLLLRLNYFKNY